MDQEIPAIHIEILRPPVSSRDHRQGNLTAPATLLMYGAYECPQLASRRIKRLKSFNENWAKNCVSPFVISREPIFTRTPKPRRSSPKLPEGSRNSGKCTTRFLSITTGTGGEHLLQYAEELGLDMDEFESEIAQRLYFLKVREDFESGLRSGVTGTPTFFINGFRHFGLYEKEILLAAIGI